MKDLLVEFTDNGAILHKDPAVIEEKKGLPFCFLNPDLSKVVKVSPSYWVYNAEGEIVPASPEERKRRDELHGIKISENTVSLKSTFEKLEEDMKAYCSENLAKCEKSLKEQLEDIQSINSQIVNTIDVNTMLFKKGIEENKKYIEALNMLNLKKFEHQEKTNKFLGIGMVLSILLTILFKIL